MPGSRALLATAVIVLAAAIAVIATRPAPDAALVEGRPEAPQRSSLAGTITLEWVGDIALSTERGLPPGGLARSLRPVRKLLRHADVTAGNLEGTLSVGGASKCAGAKSTTCFAFQAPPSVAPELRSLGFDLVNQANNHAMDYGPSGQAQTIAALRRAHVAHTGLPHEVTLLHLPRANVAFLGFAPYPYDGDLLDIPAAQRLVRGARRRAALVVVMIHAGAEGAGALHTPRGSEIFLGENRGDARAFAHAVIDAGASIVLGSGPHVIRGIERYRGRLIAYSLGNFVGYRTLGGGGVLSESAILRVTLGNGGRVLAGRWIPILLADGLPRPDPSHASAKLVAALSKSDFPHDRFTIGPSGLFHLPKVVAASG